MNRDVDRLDAAIDHVAKRLVAVPGREADLTQQIIRALPDRSSRHRWLIPQFVALGTILAAVVLWTTRDRSMPATAMSSSAFMPMAPFATTANPQLLWPGTQPSERLEPLDPLEPLERTDGLTSVDFDRALTPITPMNALSLSELSLIAIAPPASIEPAAIEITEMPAMAGAPPRPEE